MEGNVKLGKEGGVKLVDGLEEGFCMETLLLVKDGGCHRHGGVAEQSCHRLFSSEKDPVVPAELAGVEVEHPEYLER